jgi:hypothetical protein
MELRPTHKDSSENNTGQHDMHKSGENEDTSAHVNASEWQEDGVPTAGTDCEVETSFHKVTAEIKLYDGDSVVYRPTVGSLYAERISDCTFRPLRTEEDKAVEAMLEVNPYSPAVTWSIMSRVDFCRALYQAGYRKTAAEKES